MALRDWLTVLLLGWLVTSCRDTSFCQGAGDCPSEPGAAAQGPAGGTSSGSGEEAAPDPDGGQSAGHDGGAGMSGYSDAGAPTADQCPAGYGECDSSSLTACETNLLRNVRHCGACKNACDGLCVLGNCKPPELLFKDGGPSRVVATQDAAFAVLTDLANQHHALYRFDLITGDAGLVTQLDSSEDSISLGVDHVYLDAGGQVLAVSLDGSTIAPVENEAGPISTHSFGATGQGLYYIDADDDESVWTLYYRPNHATKWQVLLDQADRLQIESAGLGALALVSTDASGVEHELTLVVGDKLTSLGLLPVGWQDLIVVDEEIAVLVTRSSVEPSELWWFPSSSPLASPPASSPEPPPVGPPPVSYPVDSVLYASHPLKLAPPWGVALQTRSGLLDSVRAYSRGGPQGWAAGISRQSSLAFINRTQVWYLYIPNWVDPPLLYRSALIIAEEDL